MPCALRSLRCFRPLALTGKALKAIVLIVCAAAQARAAEYVGPLFDARLHYNQEAWEKRNVSGVAAAQRVYVLRWCDRYNEELISAADNCRA